MASIRVSEKHGVNPSIEKCYWCGEDKGTLVLMGRLPGDAEAPRVCVVNKEPCDTCKERMQTHVLFLAVDESKTTDKNEPWRTGLLAWIPEAVIREQVQDEGIRAHILKARVAFVTTDQWTKLGLPGEETVSRDGGIIMSRKETPDDRPTEEPNG